VFEELDLAGGAKRSLLESPTYRLLLAEQPARAARVIEIREYCPLFRLRAWAILLNQRSVDAARSAYQLKLYQ